MPHDPLPHDPTPHDPTPNDPAARRASLDLAPARTAAGTVRVPGSKSVSIRALLLAALASGTTRLTGVLRSDDTRVMIDALAALGVPMVVAANARDPADLDVVVDGAPSFPRREADVFVGNSGLSIRTLVAALAFAGGRYRLSGVPRMHERPIADLVDALTGVGARIACERRAGYPPLSIDAPRLPAPDDAATRVIRVRGDVSSQFLTGLLQASPFIAGDADVVVEVDGPLISRPYVDLTIASMARFGAIVREGSPGRFRVARGTRYVAPRGFVVEGDASSASYLLAAGLLGGGPVRVDGIGRTSVQGDARFVDVLVAMGAEVAQDDDATEVRSPGVASGFRLRAIDADFDAMPDAAMTVAVLALFADGPSTLRGIGSWRVKETDRLAAMAAELAKFGARVATGDDWLRIEPASHRGSVRASHAAIEVATYDDHRMAMCFSLTRFLGGPVRIVDPDCVAKTFPDYFERFERLVRRHDEDADPRGVDATAAASRDLDAIGASS